MRPLSVVWSWILTSFPHETNIIGFWRLALFTRISHTCFSTCFPCSSSAKMLSSRLSRYSMVLEELSSSFCISWLLLSLIYPHFSSTGTTLDITRSALRVVLQPWYLPLLFYHPWTISASISFVRQVLSLAPYIWCFHFTWVEIPMTGSITTRTFMALCLACCFARYSIHLPCRSLLNKYQAGGFKLIWSLNY